MSRSVSSAELSRVGAELISFVSDAELMPTISSAELSRVGAELISFVSGLELVPNTLRYRVHCFVSGAEFI